MEKWWMWKKPAARAASEEEEAQARREIEACIALACRAVARGEAEGAAFFMAPGYRVRAASGREYGKAEAHANLQQFLDALSEARHDSAVRSLRLSIAPSGEHEATVETFERAEGVTLFEGEAVRLVVEEECRDTWARTPHGWRVRQSHVLAHTETITRLDDE